MLRNLVVYQAGLVDYRRCCAFQEELVAQLRRSEERHPAHLLLVRHSPILTMGRSASADNVLATREEIAAAGIDIQPCSRGGDVTYHGPGQIVGYPVVPLRGRERDVHAYLRRLEGVIIAALDDYGIDARRRDAFTGVWVGEEKICAIGIAIRGWVTYHGFALNVDPDLSHFAVIHPCGIRDRSVTSLRRSLGHPVDEAEVEESLIRHFVRLFSFDTVERRGMIPDEGTWCAGNE